MTTPSVPPAPPPTSTAAPAISGTPPVAPKKRSNEAKWGTPIVKAGWTCIPNILIRRQRTLGLDSLDLNILLHLLSYWWEDENHPHPSKETLAQAMNVSASTIQRRIRAMEAGKLLKRIERRRAGDRSETNLYDLTPLRDLLEPQALQELAERSAGHEKRRKRMTSVNVVKP
ncbi:TPA: helix-turn-helix domain-containing protein [Pseudomonas aeruginosa]|uniref:helix-turn-helix domain-containing protein n=1 Tax=Pseudomonas aeruginosa TaxID=287 RepID=UPI0012DA7D42|nr:helix-turn-helix domain-containing protein [Pseudomonas aeruginosa]MBG3936323.1 helix-turn-helix domain-containing protein [Pseudomonas aeruginosa]MUH87747.1 helix-turn-helix domain-containing protein [Pseudomonas aeruginosa]HCF3841184.1 helix-turn-helix domain-containing protein [Pseudomonas aeruginosa]